jgi:magnesium chelatase subunit D
VNANEAQPLDAPAVWADAVHAAALLAVDPQGLGGIVVRAGAGPVRERWLQALRAQWPAKKALRRMPMGIADERLLGGLDLAATLRSGKPVAQRGLLAESDGGVVLVSMAERLSAATAARLCAALDLGEVSFERDGLSSRWPARVAVVALDESTADDAPPAAALQERLAFIIDLQSLSLRDCEGLRLDASDDATDIAQARRQLTAVTMDDALLRAICGTALQLGVNSLRASQHAVRAARAAAALRGDSQVSEADALLATRLVLAPRATRRPSAPEEAQEQTQEQAQAQAQEQAQAQALEPEQPAQEPPPQAQRDDNSPSPQEQQTKAIEDRLVEATVAALPAGLLAAMLGGDGGQQSGRVGALTSSPRFGRPVGTRRGGPRGGARLNLIETLRAAAPWQRLRAAAAPERAGRLLIHADDLRVSRLQQRAATATLFVIDASGSSALHRLAEAKGAVNLLLADCYVRRDQVAVIAFRGKSAELLLPPTRSLVRAKRCLAGLPGGGGTPLAAGLQAALLLSRQVRRSGATPIVVLLTDGRGNVALNGDGGRAKAEEDALAVAKQLRAARLTTLLVDTSAQPAPAAQKLAQALAAHYRALPYAGAAALQAAVKSLPRQALPQPAA